MLRIPLACVYLHGVTALRVSRSIGNGAQVLRSGLGDRLRTLRVDVRNVIKHRGLAGTNTSSFDLDCGTVAVCSSLHRRGASHGRARGL